MAEITQEMVKQAYIIAIKVINNEISKNDGKKFLYEKYGLNEGSASIFIYNIKYLINGQPYSRIMKPEDTQYILMQILNDYGDNVFRKALKAVRGHINYIKNDLNKSSNVEKMYYELIKKHNINDEGNIGLTVKSEIEEENDFEINSKLNNNTIDITYERDLQKALVRQVENLFEGYKIFGENLIGVEYQIEGKRIDLLLESESKIVSKHIRKILKPFLEKNNFVKVTDRNYIKTVGIFDFIIEIKSVGNYFTEVTGFPSQSTHITSGVFCNVIKKWHKKEYHYQFENLISLDQSKYSNNLWTENKKRKDIWWIDDDSDLELIVNDFLKSIEKYSFPFFEKYSNKKIENIIDEIENNIDEIENNINDKYFGSFRLFYLYKHLNMDNKAEERRKIFIEEGKKLGLKEKDLIKNFED